MVIVKFKHKVQFWRIPTPNKLNISDIPELSLVYNFLLVPTWICLFKE